MLRSHSLRCRTAPIVAKLDALLARVNACRERLDKIPKLLARFRQSVLAAACSGRLTADWRTHFARTLTGHDVAASLRRTHDLAGVPQRGTLTAHLGVDDLDDVRTLTRRLHRRCAISLGEIAQFIRNTETPDTPDECDVPSRFYGDVNVATVRRQLKSSARSSEPGYFLVIFYFQFVGRWRVAVVPQERLGEYQSGYRSAYNPRPYLRPDYWAIASTGRDRLAKEQCRSRKGVAVRGINTRRC